MISHRIHTGKQASKQADNHGPIRGGRRRPARWPRWRRRWGWGWRRPSGRVSRSRETHDMWRPETAPPLYPSTSRHESMQHNNNNNTNNKHAARRSRRGSTGWASRRPPPPLPVRACCLLPAFYWPCLRLPVRLVLMLPPEASVVEPLCRHSQHSPPSPPSSPAAVSNRTHTHTHTYTFIYSSHHHHGSRRARRAACAAAGGPTGQAQRHAAGTS